MEHLPPGELLHFSYSSLDRLGIPAYSTALWPEGGAFCNGLGYGMSEAEAMISAFGELFESAAAQAILPKAPRVSASYAGLVEDRGEAGVLDPLEACLEAGSSYDHGRVLRWVEARRYPGGEPVLVPVEFAATRFADLSADERETLITPITNGLGAGPTLEHALSHALLELVQRDGNSVSYRALDRGVAVDVGSASDPETQGLLDHLDSQGVEVIVKRAECDLDMTNLYVVGYDRDPEEAPHPLALSACGEAAHPSRETALRKSLLEYVAARARRLFNHGPLGMLEPVTPPGYLKRFRDAPLGSEEERSLRGTLEWLLMPAREMKALLQDPIYAVRETVPLASLPHAGTEVAGLHDRASLLDAVVRRLNAAGLDVLYVDLSPAGEDGPRAVKAVVPGLEVETMSYGRIGARNLRRLLDHGSDLVRVGERPEEGARILLPEREESELGPAWLDRAAVQRTLGPLYPLYREPGRHVAALAAEERATG
jgi:thiazole/oxazole-forming peptide maturase SagD family component